MLRGNPFHSRLHPLAGLPWALLLLLPLTGPAAAAQTYGYPMLLPADAGPGDLIGQAVAVSGTQIVFGSGNHDHGALIVSGGAWIYEWQGSWQQTAELVPADLQSQDNFGASVAITTDRALIGMVGDDDQASNAGAAYVFEKIAGNWVEVAKLKASDGATGYEFGAAVDIDGDFAIVGAPRAGVTPLNAGKAYVFQRQAGGLWLEVDQLTATDAQSSDEFGRDVALSGTRAIVGAPRDDDGGGNSGSAYLFDRQLDANWLQVAKLIASDDDAGDFFGTSVDVSGDTAVAGAYLDEAQGVGNGSAYVYERQGDGSWLQGSKLLPPPAGAGDRFGWSVAVDGDVVAVGAHNTIVSPWIEAGRVYVYERGLPLQWIEVAMLDRNPAEAGEHFGIAIALDGGHLVAGVRDFDVTAGNDNTGGVATYFVYAGANQAAPLIQGTGTPGCNGTQTLGMTLPPEIGSTGFAFTCDNAPPLSTGYLALGPLADLPGSDPLGLGFLLHVDLAGAPLIFFGFQSAGNGSALYPLPIPNNPVLVGTTWHAQSAWLWTTCALPPFGLSSSTLLTFTFLQP